MGICGSISPTAFATATAVAQKPSIGYYDHNISHFHGTAMRTVSVAEAKARLSELLSSVESGEEVLITRHGRAVARVTAPEVPRQLLPLKRLALLRKNTRPWSEPSAKLLDSVRDEE